MSRLATLGATETLDSARHRSRLFIVDKKHGIETSAPSLASTRLTATTSPTPHFLKRLSARTMACIMVEIPRNIHDRTAVSPRLPSDEAHLEAAHGGITVPTASRATDAHSYQRRSRPAGADAHSPRYFPDCEHLSAGCRARN